MNELFLWFAITSKKSKELFQFSTWKEVEKFAKKSKEDLIIDKEYECTGPHPYMEYDSKTKTFKEVK